MVRRQLGPADHLAELIRPERELATRRHRRVLLAQAPGRRVTRIHQHPQPRRFVLVVERRKHRGRHVDLAPHLDHLGRCAAALGERVGDVADRAHIGGDVLADPTVSPCRGADEASVFVAQAHRQPVDLELGHELRRHATQPAHDALRPRLELLGAHHVVEARHRHGVHDGGERRRRHAPHRCRRRRLVDDFWMLRLERAQLAQQHVVLGVGQLGSVVLVVEVVVVRDQLPQLHDPFHVRAGHGVTHRA